MQIEKNVIVSLDNSDKENFVIPASVTDIRIDMDSMVLYMPNIKIVTVEKGNHIYKVVDGCLINTATKTLIMGIDNATIPDDGSVEKIGAYAFNMRSLKSLVIPEGVREIGYMAFASLNVDNERVAPLTVKLPRSVQKIASRAFAFGGNIAFDASENADYYIEGGCLIERNTGKFISAFGKDITVPECVTRLPEYAFLFEQFESVRLHEHIAKIGGDAFKGCGVRDGDGNMVLPCAVYAPKNSYAWRYLARNKITRKAM